MKYGSMTNDESIKYVSINNIMENKLIFELYFALFGFKSIFLERLNNKFLFVVENDAEKG